MPASVDTSSGNAQVGHACAMQSDDSQHGKHGNSIGIRALTLAGRLHPKAPASKPPLQLETGAHGVHLSMSGGPSTTHMLSGSVSCTCRRDMRCVLLAEDPPLWLCRGTGPAGLVIRHLGAIRSLRLSSMLRRREEHTWHPDSAHLGFRLACRSQIRCDRLASVISRWMLAARRRCDGRRERKRAKITMQLDPCSLVTRLRIHF
jgi:hypothetical protein